jgi:hypothetical protein
MGFDISDPVMEHVNKYLYQKNIHDFWESDLNQTFYKEFNDEFDALDKVYWDLIAKLLTRIDQWNLENHDQG